MLLQILKNILKVKSNEEKVFVSKGIVVAAKISKKRIKDLALDKAEFIDTKLFSDLPTARS